MGDAEDTVDDVDDAVDGADVLLDDGGIDPAAADRHLLVARRVVKPDAVLRQRRGRGEGLKLERKVSCEVSTCRSLKFECR